MPMVPPVDGVLHNNGWSDTPFIPDQGIRCGTRCQHDFKRNMYARPAHERPLDGGRKCEPELQVVGNCSKRLPCKLRRWHDDVYGVYKQREQLCSDTCPADINRRLVRFKEHLPPLKREVDRVTHTVENKIRMYQTSNEIYGMNWQSSPSFRNSITQSTPYRQLSNTRRLTQEQVPPMKAALENSHNPTHPCNIVTTSNLPTNKSGKFTNYRRDLYSNSQGIWSNASFNRQRATADNHLGTYSNLQGGWARVGPTTYQSTHYDGDLVPDWMTYSYDQPEKRTYTDASNNEKAKLFVESGWR